MADDSDFLSNLFSGGNMPPGLLSQDDEKRARVQGLLGLSAGLLQAGGTPSPVKGGSWGRGLAAGVQGLLSGYNGAVDQGMKRQLVRGQLTEQQMKLLNMALQFDQAGMARPAWLSDAINKFGSSSGPSATPAQLAPTVPSMPSAPATGAPSAPARVPSGTDATPGVTSGAPTNLGPTADSMGIPRISLTDPKTREQVTGALADNAKLTTDQKEARDAGYKTVEEWKRAQKTAEEDQKMGSAAYSQALAGQQLRNLAGRLQPALQNANMVTAPGFDIKNLVNQFKVLMGTDPGAMAPTEMVRQMAAQEMLKTMQEVAGSYQQAGEKAPRWFQTMVEQVEKSLADPEKLSLPSMQNMLERMKREGGRDEMIGREMLKFRAEHGGKLGDAWMAHRLDLTKNDIYTKEETAALNGLAEPPAGSGIADIRSPAVRNPTPPPPPAPAGGPAPHPSIGDVVPFRDKNGADVKARYKGGNVNDAKSWEVLK